MFIHQFWGLFWVFADLPAIYNKEIAQDCFIHNFGFFIKVYKFDIWKFWRISYATHITFFNYCILMYLLLGEIVIENNIPKISACRCSFSGGPWSFQSRRLNLILKMIRMNSCLPVNYISVILWFCFFNLREFH